jgi:RNase P subunit RPR2
MPKATRVICHACRAQLGVVVNDRLTGEGQRVEYGSRGTLTIVCTTCKSPRPWTDRRGP